MAKLKEHFIIFLKGLFMGSADIVPGISGGTIALITGIYERLIYGIKNVFEFISLVLKGEVTEARRNIRIIDIGFFIPLLTGISLAFLILSKLIENLLQNFTGPIYGFFFGLILASAGVIYKYVHKLDWKNILFSLAGFVFAFLFVGLKTLGVSHSLPVIFLSGVAALCAMILPGISGAFILLFLGQYQYMLGALNSLNFLVIFTFLFGGLIGLLFFSKILSYLLKNYESFTMSFLFGLMLGALRIPYQHIIESMDTVLIVFIYGVFGFLIVFGLEMKFKYIK